MTDPNLILLSALTITAITLSITSCVLIYLRLKSSLVSLKALVSAILVVIYLLSPGVASKLLMTLQKGSFMKVYIDPETWLLFFPAIISICASIAFYQGMRVRVNAS